MRHKHGRWLTSNGLSLDTSELWAPDEFCISNVLGGDWAVWNEVVTDVTDKVLDGWAPNSQ